MRALAFAATLFAGCDYADTIGRTFPPPMPGALEPTWVRAVGEVGIETGDAIAIASNGDVVVAGTTNPEPEPTPGSQRSIYVARRAAADGAHVWETIIPSTDRMSPTRTSIGSDGSVLVCGAGEQDLVVARLDTNGTLLWQRGLGATGRADPRTCWYGRDDLLIVSGVFQGTLDLGSGGLVADADGDAFLVAFDLAGALVWGHAFQGAGWQSLYSATATPDGDLVVVASTSGAVSFGGAALEPGELPLSTIVAFSAGGEYRWQLAATEDALHRVGVDYADRLVVVTSDRTPPEDRASISLVSATGSLLSQANVLVSPRPRFVTVFPTGMVALASQDYGGTMHVDVFDAHGTPLGGSTFHAVDVSDASYGPEMKMAASADSQLALVGDLDWGVDFGTGPVYASECIPPGTGGGSRSGADAFAVLFKWVEH